MARKEFESYEDVHTKLVEAMQEACTKDEAADYRIPDIVPGFIYEKYNSEQKSKMFASRFSKIAAIFMIILLGLNLITLNSNSGEVYGDKGLLHRIFEGSRGIFTDQDDSNIVEFDENSDVYILNDYKYINDAKKFWPDLYIPNYITEEYSFSNLKIYRDISGEYFAEYDYCINEDTIEINIVSLPPDNKVSATKKGEMIILQDRKIYIYNDNIYKKMVAEVYLDNAMIFIYGNINKSEILKIAKNICK